MAESSNPDLTDTLQQELTQLRQRVTQLEQQLAAVQPATTQTHEFPDFSSSLVSLQTIAASIPGTIFQFSTRDGDWKMDYISDRVVDLTGITATEIMQDMGVLSRHTYPADRHHYFHSLFKAVSTGTPWRYEGRIVQPNGTIAWCQGEAVPVPATGDRIVFCGVMLDITDRKKTEAALQQSEAHWQQLFEHSADAISLQSLEQGVFITCNQAALEITRLPSKEQLIGKTPLDFSPEQQPDGSLSVTKAATMRATALEQGNCRFEWLTQRFDGTTVWVEVVLTRMSFNDEPTLLSIWRDISEFKQAEAALEESRRFLHLVLDTLPNQHIFWKDRNSIFLGCNRLGAGVAGVESPAAIVGKTNHELAWTTEEADFFLEDDRRIMDSNQPQLGLIESQIRPNGQQVWLELNKVPLHDAQGEVIGILIAFQDVTERHNALCDRKRTAAQLKEKEEFLRSIYDGVDYSIFALEVTPDQSYCYLGMNSVAERAIGISPADYLGKTPEQVLAPEIAATSRQRFTACLQSGISHTWEDYLPFPQEAWWSTTLTPLKDSTGRIHRLVGTSIDTTAAKRDEVVRKRAEAQLQEQEQFLRSIYDGVACSIFVVEVQADGQFVYISYNKASEQASGVKSADIAGKTPEQRFGEQEGKAICAGYQQCVDSGSAVTCEECLTFDDRPNWFLTTLNPIRNQAGQIHRIVGTAFDITDLKQAQTQLQQRSTDLEAALQELQRTQFQMVQAEKMSSLGQLVAGVAHEINNPVNFIFGNLNHANDYTQDLLNLLKLYHKHYPNPDREIESEAEAIDLEFLIEDLPKLLNSMKVGADRIQKIVASLRTFSRMDESEMKAVNIHEGLDSTLMILQNRIKARSDRSEIKIIKTYGNLPLVECYAGQLNQVFMNLLSNAIDALEEAQPPVPTLTLQTRITDRNQLEISITDNGIGIPVAVQSRLFDPFFTTKPVGKGTGMGLSISYQIVTEKHNGSLKCLSNPGQGAAFVITIPLKLT